MITSGRCIKRVVALIIIGALFSWSNTVAMAGIYTHEDSLELTKLNTNTKFSQCISEIVGIGCVEDINIDDEELIEEEEAEEYMEECVEERDDAYYIDDFNSDNSEATHITENMDYEEICEENNSLVLVKKGEHSYALIDTIKNETFTIEMIGSDSLRIEMIENIPNSDEFSYNSAVMNILEDEVFEPQGWKTVVKETYKTDHWYQNSDTGAYVRVGCKAKYKIHYSKLKTSKKENVKKYRKAVRDTRDSWKDFKKYAAMGGIGVAMAAATVAAGLASGGGAALAADLLMEEGAFTLSAAESAVRCYKDTKSSYKTVTTKYDIIKKYGVKY